MHGDRCSAHPFYCRRRVFQCVQRGAPVRHWPHIDEIAEIDTIDLFAQHAVHNFSRWPFQFEIPCQNQQQRNRCEQKPRKADTSQFTNNSQAIQNEQKSGEQKLCTREEHFEQAECSR